MGCQGTSGEKPGGCGCSSRGGYLLDLNGRPMRPAAQGHRVPIGARPSAGVSRLTGEAPGAEPVSSLEALRGSVGLPPSTQPSLRVVPLGLRPAVPERPGFDVPMFTGILVPGFEGMARAVIEEAARLFAPIPGAFHPIVVDTLTLTPKNDRLQTLRSLSASLTSLDPEWYQPTLARLTEVTWYNRASIARNFALEHPRIERRPQRALLTTDQMRYRAGGPVPVRIPPPPAPQEVCIVNGYDPAWGAPPSKFRGIPMEFDAALGAYRFDEAYAIRNAGPYYDPGYTRTDFDAVKQTYATGYMVQPYRRSDVPGWSFRSIVRTGRPTRECTRG